jgi:hypothetical protein
VKGHCIVAFFVSGMCRKRKRGAPVHPPVELVNDAPDSSGEPVAGRRAGEVRLMNVVPIMSATVRLSTLFL